MNLILVLVLLLVLDPLCFAALRETGSHSCA